jgi:hypothetical protein
MPAMSPTMTEGGIASWKKKGGESFVAGDVLLEIVRGSSNLYPLFHAFLRIRKQTRLRLMWRHKMTELWLKSSYVGLVFIKIV